ncbi:MAG: hypothetical protein QNK35_06400 [Bacteroides sp.]|nr:hypothetical protein [Bacteroides sp.]
MFRDTIRFIASKRKELIIFLFCFLGAYLLNLIGVIQYKSPTKEMVTQFHVVLIVALVLYGALVALRIFYHLVSRMWMRK